MASARSEGSLSQGSRLNGQFNPLREKLPLMLFDRLGILLGHDPGA
jgi:hypothetical protein